MGQLPGLMQTAYESQAHTLSEDGIEKVKAILKRFAKKFGDDQIVPYGCEYETAYAIDGDHSFTGHVDMLYPEE